LIRETIESTAARGNAVIVAHAASHAAHVGGGTSRARHRLAPYPRSPRFYDLDEELPTQYDLVVNTDVLSVERAAELVVLVASS
jgi:hypothetical protein